MQRRTALRTVCRIAEQLVLLSDLKRSDRIFLAAVINRHIAVLQKCAEIRFFIQRIPYRLRQLALAADLQAFQPCKNSSSKGSTFAESSFNIPSS